MALRLHGISGPCHFIYVLFAGATALSVGLWCATMMVRFRDMQNAIS
ncbi:MAG: hypothetical protein ABFS56_23140 [Pseudomonadota bacterium]